MKHSPTKLIAVGVTCAAVGAAGGGAVAGAATHGAAGASAHHKRGAGRLLRRTVHADLVVARRNGTFATITVDRGVVRSVSGDRLTIAEGTRKSTYREITLTIPATSAIRDNHQRATFAALKPGQRVTVRQGPRRTVVRARDARRAG